MTTGQPIRFPSDRNKYNNEYMESLQLQINLNQQNLEVNRLYKETGQLPASTQMKDTRSNEEKLADVEYLKQQIISDLKPIAEPMFASAVIQGVINSPLNVNNSLFRYLAQNASSFAQTLSKKYKFGIAGDANDVEIMVQFLEDAYNKTKNTFQSIKGYINSNTNEGNKTRSNVLSSNDTDNVKLELDNIIKRLDYILTTVRREYNANLVITPGEMEQINYDANEMKTMLSEVNSFLPTNQQLQEIINRIEESERGGYDGRLLGYNPQRVKPDVDDERTLLRASLRILKDIPRPSSIATLSDICDKYINRGQWGSIPEILKRIRLLLAPLLSQENVYLLRRFRNVFIDIAQNKIIEDNRINSIEAINNIQRQQDNETLAQRAQRVYIVNPANDPALVNDVGGQGAPLAQQNPPQAPAPPQQPPGLLQQIAQGAQYINPLPQYNPLFGNAQPAQAQPMARDAYIDQNVNLLTAYGLNALSQAMANDQNIPRVDRDNLQQGLPGLGRQQKRDYIAAILKALPLNDYDPSVNPPTNNYGVGGQPGISGLGLKPKRVKKGRGLYSPFGDSEINHKNLENNILTIRRKSKTNYMDLPSKHISKHMKNIVKNIIGGKIADFEDIQNLNDEERNYLHKIVSKSNLQDRLSVPAPSKDQAERDNHQWEVMRGEIMAGNDSHELVKKFKFLTMKLTRVGLLPKNEVMDLMEALVSLGY